jgi:mono/diheme cytochrome c family protein
MLLLLAAACKHYPVNPVIPDPDPDPVSDCDPDSVYFVQQILPIFQSNCAQPGCHDAITQEEGYVFDNYAGIMEEIEPFDLNDSEIYEKITDNDPDDIMPPPPDEPLTEAQIDLIADWIMQGAPNNSCEDLLCDTTDVTYALSIKPLLDTRCKGCHSGGQPANNMTIEDYSDAATLASNGMLLAVVEHQQGVTPMPYNQPQLPDCEIAKLRIWVDDGFPNN